MLLLALVINYFYTDEKLFVNSKFCASGVMITLKLSESNARSKEKGTISHLCTLIDCYCYYRQERLKPNFALSTGEGGTQQRPLR